MKNNTTLFVNANICLPTGLVTGGSLLIRNGMIEEINSLTKHSDTIADNIVDVKGAFLAPGFVDVHVHGGGGYDAMSGDPEHIRRMSQFHATKGTTSFLPTTLTHSRSKIESAIKGITAAMETGTAGAEVLGIHLEGPFLNAIRCGAQNPEHIRLATMEEMESFIALSGGTVRLMTIAPEQEGALDLIQYAVQQGVAMSIGHSDATYNTMQQAVQSGASHVTHLFNGMSPLHHREPGVAGSALMIDELAVELICDGIHMHREVVNYVFRVKPIDKIVLITDCIAAGGCHDGEYTLGDLPIELKNGQARLINEDGSEGGLAGSSLTMDIALQNTLDFTGLSLVQVLPALTINPAKQIGLGHRKGSITVGKDADLVILNDRYEVDATYVKGEMVYEREKQS